MSKNYGLNGVGVDIQLGKNGNRLISDGEYHGIKLVKADGSPFAFHTLSDDSIVTKAQVENLLLGLDFQADILGIQTDGTLVPSTADKSRYIISSPNTAHEDFFSVVPGTFDVTNGSTVVTYSGDVGDLNLQVGFNIIINGVRKVIAMPAPSSGNTFNVTVAFGSTHSGVTGELFRAFNGDIVQYNFGESKFELSYDISSGNAGPGALVWNRDTNTWLMLDETYNWVEFGGLSGVTAGAGLDKTGNTMNVGAGSGITVNADDVAVNIGDDNGDSLEVTTSGLELRDDIGGVRTFTNGIVNGTNILPIGNGTNGQVMTTNGSGTVTWEDPASVTIPVQVRRLTITLDASGETTNIGSSLPNNAKITNVKVEVTSAPDGTGDSPTLTIGSNQTLTNDVMTDSENNLEDVEIFEKSVYVDGTSGDSMVAIYTPFNSTTTSNGECNIEVTFTVS